MFTYKLLVLIVLLPELLCVHPLHKLVKDYQTIHKDEVHHSWKQLPTLFEPVRVIKLSLWKQVVELHLSHNRDLFHPMAVAMEIDKSGNSQQHPINAHQYYTGRISDDATSRVTLHISSSGILTASVSTGNDVIYIEPASVYAKDLSADEHMFAYNRSKIIPREIDNGQRKPFCDHKDDIDVMAAFEDQLRRKRLTAPSSTDNGHVCLMHLVSDYRFFQTWGRNMTSSTIIYLARLVETADDVYRNTVWEPGLTNIGLQVGNITIYTGSGCVSYNEPWSPNGGSWTTADLLEEFSYNDWRPYCLAHLFTNQNFDSNELGLAYVASSSPALQGGICSRYSSQLPGGDPSRRGTANVGLSSFASLYGRQLLQPEAEHIFAHEVGHNWGSNHDLDTTECNPPFSENGGKFIMYPSVLGGNEPNNKKFSNCSKRWIAQALRSRPTCFIERTESLCGNYRVDPGEECDEGLENFGQCSTKEPNTCCHDNCTLKHGAKCSDRNQPCCQGCQLVAANSRLCAVENDIDCLESVYCDGEHAECPLTADPKPENTSCIDDGLCLADEAGDIICQDYCQHMYDMEPCICPSASRECLYCCRNETNGQCQLVMPQRRLPDGKPCEGGLCLNGMCDLRSADLSTRLFDFIQSLSSDTLRTTMRENIVGTIIILSLIPYVTIGIIVCCLDRHTERKYGPLFRQVVHRLKRQQWIRKSRVNSDETDYTLTRSLLH